MKLADHLGRVLAKAAYHDKRIFVLDGDLADSDGAIHFAQALPDRFLMAGIAEQSMVSVAAGMAECGLRPFVFSFAAFLCYRAYDQIRIGLSQCQQPVTLVGSHAGGLAARNGKTHAAPNDLALMLSLPHMQVWAPADRADVELAVRHSLLYEHPCYIRLPRRPITQAEHLAGMAAGMRWLLPPRQLSMASTGLGTRWALEAAAQLRSQGIQVGLLHCPFVSQPAAIARELSSAGVAHTVVIEDHCTLGGLASLLAHAQPGMPLTSLGWPTQYSGKSGSDDDLREAHGLCAAALARSIAAIGIRTPVHP